MVKPKEFSQSEYEFVSIDELVPKDLVGLEKSMLQCFKFICLPGDWSGGHSTPAG
ncbi:hypothetical protein ACSU6B_20925 [Neobacillus sp. C211]|uniref:hypothetical protein n=1 Tax=unclassified Neobacillus TaxID=2675272 RepID=UPI00397AB155